MKTGLLLISLILYVVSSVATLGDDKQELPSQLKSVRHEGSRSRHLKKGDSYGYGHGPGPSPGSPTGYYYAPSAPTPTYPSPGKGGKGGGKDKGKGGKGGKGKSGKSKSGKGDSGKGKSGKGSSGKGSKGYYSYPFPSPRPGSPVSPSPGPSPGPSPAPGSCGGCAVDVVELDFVMLPPNATVPVAVGLDGTTIGTVFIYQDSLFDLNLTALNGTFVAGLCTRTQNLQNLGANNTLVGAGYCQFTFTVSDGVTAVTFNAAGEVFDVLGGTLAITGGTGALQGVYGEVELVPFYADAGQTDYFLEAALYVGAATLSVPVVGSG